MLALAAAKAVDLGSNKSHPRLSSYPSNAHSGFRVNTDGTMEGTEATVANWAVDDGTWLYIGLAGDYEVQFTKNSGDDPDSGTLTTWQALSSSRSISFVQIGVGSRGGSFTVKIRHATTHAVLSTCTVALNATVE